LWKIENVNVTKGEDVRIGSLRNSPFKPNVHLNYAETFLPMKDGLPKLKDFPAEIGGSGQTMPE
jgi:hypothetical protein